MHAGEYGAVAVLSGGIVVLVTVIKSLVENRFLKSGAKRQGNSNGNSFSKALKNIEEEKAEQKARDQTDEIYRALMQPGRNGVPFIVHKVNKGIELLESIDKKLGTHGQE